MSYQSKARLLFLGIALIMGTVVFYLKRPTLILPGIAGLLWLGQRRSKVPTAPDDLAHSQELVSEPQVAIVICARNEAAVLAKTLAKVAQIDYPQEKLAVWIVDDGSTDATGEIIQGAIQQFPHFHTLGRKHNKGFKAGALNEIFAKISGEFIMLLDADARVSPDILQATLGLFNNPRVGALDIKKACYNRDTNYLSQLMAFERQNFVKNLSGGALILRRQAWNDSTGWDESCLTEDFEMTYQLLHNNWQIIYPSAPIVEIEGVATLRHFVKQRYRWALGDILCIFKYLTGIATYAVSVKHQDFAEFTKQLTRAILAIITLIFLGGAWFHPTLLYHFCAVILLWEFFAISDQGLILRHPSGRALEPGQQLAMHGLALLELLLTGIAFLRVMLIGGKALRWLRPHHHG